MSSLSKRFTTSGSGFRHSALDPNFDAASALTLGLGAPDVTASAALHPQMNLTTTIVVDDLDRIASGSGGALRSEIAREHVRSLGWDPDRIPRLSAKARIIVHNEIVRLLRTQLRERNVRQDLESTLHMLLSASDADKVLWQCHDGTREIETTAGRVRAALGTTVEEFLALGIEGRKRAVRRVTHRLRLGQQRAHSQQSMIDGRSAMHARLMAEWARGPLRIECPQSSSLHMLIDYDAACSEGSFARNLDAGSCQTVVVEHDWGAAVPPVDGEWRVPFPFMCWEFRVSGVRVLAFTEAEDTHTGRPEMWMVYGADDHWVIDDYFYNVGDPVLPRGISHQVRGGVWVDAGTPSFEFRRVAGLVYACIRSVCIMLDARVAHETPVQASPKLNERRRREGKTPLRDYITVRLVNTERRAHSQRPRVAGRVTDARMPQRGHWRRGTWVHFDDQDSGKEQYVNDGGFVVSRTWRSWHFAGDPNNILHKEYRA